LITDVLQFRRQAADHCPPEPREMALRLISAHGSKSRLRAKRWKKIPVLRRKTAFMFEGKEAFPHSDNLQHRYPLWDFYPGIYDRSRQFEICLRNSIKRIQKNRYIASGPARQIPIILL
jgi:hypothetical protein